VAQRGAAANESQSAKRQTPSAVCRAGESQKKIKTPRAKGKSEKPHIQKSLSRKQGIR
jgi:hypothetical protein